MSDKTLTLETLAASQAELGAKVDKLIDALTGKVGAVEASVTQITGAAELSALLTQARKDVQLTAGNEAWLEPAIRAAWEKSPEASKAFVAGLPRLGKGEGSVLDGTARFVPTVAAAAAGTSTAKRHRFDAYGPDKWQGSADPTWQAYGRKIEWIEAQEAGGRKFANAGDALRAYAQAHPAAKTA